LLFHRRPASVLFAHWSNADHDWKVDPAVFTIYAGDSSVNLPLHAELTLQ
jgi:hypothetical protein